jgi:hypothetical protein
MGLSSKPRLRAPEAVYELIDLLRLAHGAVIRAQSELQGEASNVASRLSRQLTYLRGVAEVLEHESTRPSATSTQAAGATFIAETETVRLEA